MRVSIQLSHIQQIKELQFDADFAESRLVCIAGKNGAGKTTLVKALRNLTNADTFTRTSPADIFNKDSSIIYQIDEQRIAFSYDESLKSLNSRDTISEEVKSRFAVELPFPHGERFNFFKVISEADFDIRKSIILGQYTVPAELIVFLNDIYDTDRFERLIEIVVKENRYFCILLESGKYIREDYFSSAEYFLTSLYRRVTAGCRLIVIDEIDISLDAAAQVRLVQKLKGFIEQYDVSFVFTTHSLAMMQTVDPSALFYMDHDSENHVSSIRNVSYNYIKSILFGFAGWDRYILTEDDVLKDFVEHIIQTFRAEVFYKYKIIYIGGGTNTVSLMTRNSTEEFFCPAANVISVLDGDQRQKPHAQVDNAFCIPIESVEKELLAAYLAGEIDEYIIAADIPEDIAGLRLYLEDIALNREPANGMERHFNSSAKTLFKQIIHQRRLSKQRIFEIICQRRGVEIAEFAGDMRIFLTGV